MATFGKSDRWEPHPVVAIGNKPGTSCSLHALVPCPCPIADKHPNGSIRTPRSDKLQLPQNTTPMGRSHSSPSIATSTTSKTKEKTPCNKPALKGITMARHHAVTNNETKENKEPAQPAQSSEVDDFENIPMLKAIIEELKTTLEKEETMRKKFEAELKKAIDDKKEMEVQVSEYGLKLENQENVSVGLVKEIELMKESQSKELEARDIQHKSDLEEIKAASVDEIQLLEKNLQDLGAKLENLENVSVGLVKKMELMKESHLKELEARDNQHQTELKEFQAATRENIKSYQDIHTKQLDLISNQHVEEMKGLNMDYAKDIADIRQNLAAIELKYTQLK